MSAKNSIVLLCILIYNVYIEVRFNISTMNDGVCVLCNMPEGKL